jgi:hypothetical protein
VHRAEEELRESVNYADEAERRRVARNGPASVDLVHTEQLFCGAQGPVRLVVRAPMPHHVQVGLLRDLEAEVDVFIEELVGEV